MLQQLKLKTIKMWLLVDEIYIVVHQLLSKHQF